MKSSKMAMFLFVVNNIFFIQDSSLQHQGMNNIGHHIFSFLPTCFFLHYVLCVCGFFLIHLYLWGCFFFFSLVVSVSV